jgi:hypothetical protein
VAYKVLKPRWTDCGKIKKHYRSKIQLKKMFKECCGRNATLTNGKIYACAFSANLARLGIFDSEASCDYCSGRGLNDKTIEPAIQIK